MIKARLSGATIEFLRDLITGDSNESPYLRGRDICEFFTEAGIATYYGPRGMPGNSSRGYYVHEMLKEINGTTQMTKLITLCFDKRRFINTEYEKNYDDLVDKFNEFLTPNNYRLDLDEKRVRVKLVGSHLASVGEIENIDNDVIHEELEKCESKISDGDYDGAISSARSFLESVLLHLFLKKTGNEYVTDGDLIKLYKKVAILYDFYPEKKTEMGLKQLTQGLITAINGFAMVRNKIGDSHGKINKMLKPEEYHATLVVNSCRTISIFLLELQNQENKPK